MRGNARLVGGFLLVCLAGAAPAWAQRSLNLDPGVRGAGMGGAVTASIWGGDADAWGNPALLGYRDGLRYTFGTTKLIPELTDDVVYRTQQVSLGWSGIGLGVSSLTLDYGDSEGTDPKGNPTGSFASTEHAAVYGLGVSLSGVLAALAGVGEATALPRYVDLAVGGTIKQYDIDLAPGIGADTDAGDWGMTVRISPIPEGSGGVFADVVYGHAVIDYDDGFVGFPDETPIALPRLNRNGFAVRLGLPMSDRTRGNMPSWITGGLGPLVALTVAGDFVTTTSGDLDDGFDHTHVGIEADLMGLLALRVGKVSDDDDVDGTTFGFGLGFPIREWAGVRYDFASVPAGQDLDRQMRHAASVFVDPIALFQGPRGD